MSIEKLIYDPSIEEGFKGDPFFNGPAEFLVREIVKDLLHTPEWAEVFTDSIYPYRREDFSIRELPGIRVYNESATKEFESWFLEGEIKIDLILPADIRREETQQIQDTLSAALVQQFRRPELFEKLCERVPGLNELGKRVTYDKSLGFEWNSTVVPLTQTTINFRIDLRKWDAYLEETLRTKDTPYKESIGDLRRLVGTIEALKEDLSKQTDLGTDQEPGVEEG